MDPEETDVVSQASSINLDELGDHSLIKNYRAPDIEKKRELLSLLVPEEIEEMKLKKRKMIDPKLYKINLTE